MRRITPSLVVSIIALVAATGGVGYAATKIGSKQIANNSIKSEDVKNGSLQTKDLSSGTVKALEGQDGAPGAPGVNGKDGTNGTNGKDGADGAAGPKGDTGPRGPTGATGSIGPVISRRKANATVGAGGTIQVFSESLPAGSYVIQAKADLAGVPAGSAASCVLKVGSAEVDRSNAFAPALSPNQPGTKIQHAPTITAFAALTLTATRTVAFTCEAEGANTPNATNASLLVTSVGVVTRSSDVADPSL